MHRSMSSAPLLAPRTPTSSTGSGKRALVLSASGVRAAYEIGVLHGLIEHAPPENLRWTHVFGSSGGALVAAILCMYPPGQERAAVQHLERLIVASAGESGMRPWYPFGMVQGLLWSKCLFSPVFLQKLVHENVNVDRIRSSGRHFCITAVDYASAQPRTFTHESPPEVLLDAIIASCSVPVIFPPHPIVDSQSPSGKSYYGDGGLTDFVPIRCGLDTYDDLDHIDVIVSVGTESHRVMGLPRRGDYPDLVTQANSILQIFYRSVDRFHDTIDAANHIVYLKRFAKQNPAFWQDLPPEEQARLNDAFRRCTRDRPLRYTTYRPDDTTIALTTTGAGESPSTFLWNLGIQTARTVWKPPAPHPQPLRLFDP